MMTEEEYFKRMFNEVHSLTAVCRSIHSWAHGEYDELEVGKTYAVTHIGVLRSATNILLEGFGRKSFNSTCFDLYEDGVLCNHGYTHDPRFWAPYLREEYRVRNSLRFAGNMEKIAIPAHLKNIEHEFDVKVLLAVESGSRAWGFESLNSDWDVRFIYIHKPEWYFKVEEQRDVIEYMYEDDVDLVGWDLKKALGLLRRSNPSLLEWFHSPKVYYVDNDFVKRIAEIEENYYNPVKSMYHYNRIYNKQNERFLQKEGVPMKKYLYYLRGILACRWIELYKTIPPVEFRKLLDEVVKEDNIREKVYKLIEVKKTGKECDITMVDDDLVDYARRWADYYNESIGTFRPEQNNVSADPLDSILYDIVCKRDYWRGSWGTATE